MYKMLMLLLCLIICSCRQISGDITTINGDCLLYKKVYFTPAHAAIIKTWPEATPIKQNNLELETRCPNGHH